MKKIVLISTFCDTEEKLQILQENIIILKNKGLDVMCLSPNFIQLPNDIIKLSDFIFYTKENPVMNSHTRSFVHWWEVPIDNGLVRMVHYCDDYGWAALYQTKKLSEIALTFDYDIFYHTIYDILLDDQLLLEIDNNEVNMIHPKRDHEQPGVLWDSSLHFMVYDREMMEKIANEITLEEYLKPSDHKIAEGEVLKWKEKFNIPTKGCVIDDQIHTHNVENDFFNYLNYKDFKFFVKKDYEGYPESASNGKLAILFHNITSNRKIGVEINEIYYEYFLNIDNNKLITFDINCDDVSSFNVKVNDKTINFMEIYEKINLAELKLVEDGE